jgi:acyl carrier protein
MNAHEFLRDLEEALDVKEGSCPENGELGKLDFWDSMAALTFITLADEKLGVAVPGDRLVACRTVSDLLSLLGDRITRRP